MKKLFGNDVVVMLGDEAIAYGTTCTVKMSAEMIEISSKESGRFRKYKKGKISWTASSGHIMSTSDQAKRIMDMAKSREKVKLLVASVKEHAAPISASDYEPDGRFAFKGWAFIKDASITANRGSMASMSVEFQGTGEALLDKDAELPDDTDNNEGGGGGDGGDITLGQLLNVISGVDSVAADDRLLFQEAGSGTWSWKNASEIMPDIDKIKAQLYGAFLRKDADDRTPYNLTVGGKLTAEEGLMVGEYINSIYAGSGASIDADGNAELQSVSVRGELKAWEYVVNRQQAIEGDVVFTESDTIETVDDLGDGCYGLHLRSKWDGYFTAQVDNNILRGKMNSLAEGSGTYYDAWMRVNTVNASANYIEVVCYPDDEVPSGKNYPPCAGMNVARWGNQTDETRQSSLYISSTEGRLVRLRNVTKPIIDITKYGTVIGQMPDVIKALSPLIAEGEDYIYARGVITTNFIEIDPQGVPVATVVDRGDFDENADYYAGGWRDETKKYEISDVWKSGCRWRCAKEGTHTVPRWNNTDWAMKEGNTALTVEFEEMEQLYDADNFHATLTVVARLYNEDITEDIPSENIEWTRYTEDLDGNERTDSDNIWAQRHAGAGRRISLEWEDLNAESYIPPVIRFICTVTVRDGMKDSAVLTYE